MAKTKTRTTQTGFIYWLKTYYELTKPGRIYANVLTAAAGFLLAAKWHVDIGLLAATLGGTSLIIAAASVYNNYIDRDIDKQMARTKDRALVRGEVSAPSAIIYASFLLVAGFLLLAFFTNWLVVLIGAVGFIDYVILYGIAKRRTVYGTLIGCVSGAVSVVAGYTAVRGHFDMGSLLLFLIMMLWQMPHSFAIGIYRLKDYAAAGIPVLPVKKGVRRTKIEMVLYSVAFLVSMMLLTFFGYAGYIYLAVMTVFGVVWVGINLKGFQTQNDQIWARKSFLFSLSIIPALSIMLAVGSIIP